MTNVLFVALHFPPTGGAGVQRSLKMVRYLSPLGYRSVVITGTDRPHGRWTPPDETMLAEIPDDTVVHRLPPPEPAESTGRRARLERMLMRETRFARWWIDGAERLGRQHGRDCDLIYVSLIPYETARAARRLAEDLQKPLVLDLQDPWALDEFWIYPSGLHRRVDLRRMRRALAAADGVVMNTPEAAARVVRRFPELDGRVVSIPNGFDPSDFAGPAPQREDGKFRIVHTGYLHTADGLRQRRTGAVRRALGGDAAEVDILPRSHVYLLEALDRLFAAQPALASVVEVHLAGVLTEADREVAARSRAVRLHGYLAHDETVTLMRSADLLFLPMHDLPPGTRAGIVPGKTYEYLASGRPILAAVPEGDARDLLLEAGSAVVCGPADVSAMAELLRAEVDRWREHRPRPVPHPDVLRRYERQRQARDLAEFFGLVLERRR